MAACWPSYLPESAFRSTFQTHFLQQWDRPRFTARVVLHLARHWRHSPAKYLPQLPGPLTDYARCPAILMSQRYYDDSVKLAIFGEMRIDMHPLRSILVIFLLCLSGNALTQTTLQTPNETVTGEELFVVCTFCHGDSTQGNDRRYGPALAGLEAGASTCGAGRIMGHLSVVCMDIPATPITAEAQHPIKPLSWKISRKQ